MATTNGQSATSGEGGVSSAQKLLQKHDDTHQPAVEEVIDEDDLKHGEQPKSSSILESTEDAPVPTWAPTLSSKAAGKQKDQEPLLQENTKPSLDTQSEELFPGLGGSGKGQARAVPIWNVKSSSANLSPVDGNSDGLVSSVAHSKGSTPTSGTATPTTTSKPAAPRAPGVSIPGRHTERIIMEPAHMLPRTAMKKPLADVLKDINKKSKANVTMQTGERGNLHFTASGPVDATRQSLNDLVKQIGSKQSVTVTIPRSTRAHIIGKQGSTIKSIQEKTGARIQMPKTDETSPFADDDDDATIDVVIEGNSLSAEMARREVLKIVGERTATSSQKLRGIPVEFYPFIAGPKNAKIQALEEGKDVRIHVPVQHTLTAQSVAPNDFPITLSGERVAVQEARVEIERFAQELRRQLTKEEMPLPNGRHQFIIGEGGIPAHQFLAETGCAINLPGDSEDDFITIVGPSDRIQEGLEKAMDLASSMQSSNMDISRHYRNVAGGGAAHARNVTRYLQTRDEIKRLEKAYNAQIRTPILPEGSAPWEIYSRDVKETIRAQSEIASLLNGHPPTRMANIQVDPFFHQHIRKEVSPKIQESYGVHTVLPQNPDSDSAILLVFEGPLGSEPAYQVPRTQPTPAEVIAFRSALDDATKYILSILEGQEPIASETIDVPLEFHEKLRKFIKKEQQDRTVEQIPVRVTQSGTRVTLRGTTSAVNALATKVNDWVLEEREDAKERGFTLSFDFPQKHANQLIGKGGSNIRELRDKFDVDIQVDDGQVKLTGPQKKAEAAKSHITGLGKQWADETTHTLKIEPKYHRELIGAQGNIINRLQERYKVQIHFPRGARPVKDDSAAGDNTSEAAGPKKSRNQAEDEVLIRGPSKGANEARDEILSYLQFLKDTSHLATVSVQQSYVPQLIGQGGKGMDELRQLTGARIDIPGSRDAKDPSGLVEIQIKGTKTQVAQAKKLLDEKKAVFDKTVSRTLEVDKKHHRSLIGAGGSKLRDIVVNAGGSDDRRELARTVQFPKSEDDGNIIKIEGNQDVVEKIIAAMNEIVAQRDAQVVETVDVPTDKHRTLIGRGGETKKALESKLNVAIDIPRQGDGRTGVKISGEPAAVEKAKAHILDLVKGEEGETVQVPKKYHHVVSDNGQFFRLLRNNHSVTVDHAGHKLPPKPVAPANTRAKGGSLPLITDDQDVSTDAHSWTIINGSSDEQDGEIPWILRGSPENIARARAQLAAAIKQAENNTTTGYLVLPDPRTYRYVIGQGGSKVNAIRKATGCKINVPRDQAAGEAIEILGSEEGVERAKEMVLEAVKEGGNNGVNGGGRGDRA